jgi:hypothetical protein
MRRRKTHQNDKKNERRGLNTPHDDKEKERRRRKAPHADAKTMEQTRSFPGMKMAESHPLKNGGCDVTHRTPWRRCNPEISSSGPG